MSLINDALRRADGDKGPRRPAPPVLPPTPRRTRFAPPPPPPPPATREGRGWTSLQAAVLGAALIAVTVAGVLIWKRVSDTPTQVAAASSDPASLSSVLAAAAQAAQKPAAPEPSSRAGDADNPRSSLVITPARSTQGAKAADPSPPAANLSPSVRDVFASPPTLFMDARKSQTPTAEFPLTPAESPAATLDATRLASAFIAAARGSPHPVAEKPAAPAGETPATAPAATQPPAAAPAAETPKLKVTSIFYNARSPTAIINGTVAGVGETVEGAKVVAITPRSVDVMVDGKRVTLRL